MHDDEYRQLRAPMMGISDAVHLCWWMLVASWKKLVVSGSLKQKFYVQPFQPENQRQGWSLRNFSSLNWIRILASPTSERVIHWDQTPFEKIKNQMKTRHLKFHCGTQVPLVRVRLSCHLSERSPSCEALWWLFAILNTRVLESRGLVTVWCVNPNLI